MDTNWRIHPGEHLAEYLEVRATTSSDLACAIDEDVGVIDAIVSGEGRVTPDIAVSLEQVFGLKAYIGRIADDLGRLWGIAPKAFDVGLAQSI